MIFEPSLQPSQMKEFLATLDSHNKDFYECNGNGAVTSTQHARDLKSEIRQMGAVELKKWLCDYVDSHDKRRKAAIGMWDRKDET